MAANIPLRTSTCEPTALQLYDASKINIKQNGKYFNLRGVPNVLLKGNVKFLSATESGKLKIGMACSTEDAESLSSFIESTLKPKLAEALGITNPDAVLLGRKAPAYKKQKTSTSPSANTAVDLRFYVSPDKFDSTKSIINFYTIGVTQFYKVDLEAQTATKSDGVTQNANIEATCWLSISKSEKDEGVFYVNINSRQIMYEEAASEPEPEVKTESPAFSFGGKMLAST